MDIMLVTLRTRLTSLREDWRSELCFTSFIIIWSKRRGWNYLHGSKKSKLTIMQASLSRTL